MTVSLLFLLLSGFANAQIRFDLPPQSLAQALTAVGSLGNLNVLFDPNLVDGLQAPSLKADLSAGDAIARLLAGTRLRAVRVDEKTVRVVVESAAKHTQNTRAAATGAEHGSESARVAYARVDADSNVELPLDSDAKTASKGNPSRKELEEVVVTGTHLRGLQPSTSLITITSDDIERSGYSEVGDLIRSVPQNFAGGNSPQVSPGVAPGSNESLSGGSAPNLRGLGSTSTLTLINGHRIAQDTQLGAVDISLIPLDALDRVEVVTDGSSATYGADAVAGVVNFILKRDYQGAKTSVSFGDSTQGGGLDRKFDQTLGTQWRSGGGVFSYEFDKLSAVYSSQRTFTETAESPYTLLPTSSRNSFYLAGHQDVTSAISAFADGLYTYRNSYSVATYPPPYGTIASVKQYLVNAGFNAEFGRNWHATVLGSSSEQKTRINTSTAPDTMPAYYYSERFLGRSETFELNADGPIFRLSDRTFRLALGAGYRNESYDDTVGGSALATTDAQRNIKYAFAEASIPLVAPSEIRAVNRLDVTLAGRYERFSESGGKAVPKLGLEYSPAPSWTARSSWGRSYATPTLPAAYSLGYLSQQQVPDPRSATGQSIVLAQSGGNPQLRPETAVTWTAGVAFSPEPTEALHASLTYFNIRYTNRIASLSDVFNSLEDPADGPLVIRSPSLALQQAAFNAATGGFYNYSPVPYNPADIAALINARAVNVARQTADGVDALSTYSLEGALGSDQIFVNGTYFELRQRTSPTAPDAYLSGTTFFPPRFRVRGGSAWTAGPWSLTGTLNYISGSVNTYQPNRPGVGSWLTADAQVAWTPSMAGWSKGLRASISVLNVFDRDPPYALFDTYAAGFHYDSVNASPLGRFITLQVSKAWGW